MIKIRLLELYLVEDIDAVKRQSQFKDIPEDEFEKIIRIDPTFKEGSNSLGVYGKWLLIQSKKTDLYLPDFGYVISNKLREYDRLKNNREYNIEKDIMKFKTLADFANAIEQVTQVELSKKQAQRQAKKNISKPFFLGEDYMVFIPRDQKDAMALASYGHSKKAAWCISYCGNKGEAFYDQYLVEGGDYYIVINETNYDEKYLFQFEYVDDNEPGKVGSFADENDHQIDVTEFLDENKDLKEFFISEGKDV